LFVALIAFSLSGCSLFLSEPRVAVKDVAVTGIGADGVDIELLLGVTNDNSFALTLTGYSYDLQVLALPLTTGGDRRRIEFPGAATTDVRLPFRVPYRSVMEILKRHPDPAAIPYRLTGSLEVETPLGKTLVPVSSTGSFSVPERYRPSEILKGFGGLVNSLLR
jgi:LEA14-like dessication related protein